jgi:hypothetical protein
VGQLIKFPRKEKTRMKKIDVPTVKLMLKHHKLITNARKRGYSVIAIVKLVQNAEESLR